MDLKSNDEYQKQKLDALFGDYIVATEETLPKIRREAMELLAETIVTGIDICGYKSIKPEWIEKVPSLHGIADPLNTMGSLGGKIKSKLTATIEQYNHHLYVFAKTTLDDYQKEVEKRKTLETFWGFLKFKIKQLKERFHKKEWWKE